MSRQTQVARALPGILAVALLFHLPAASGDAKHDFSRAYKAYNQYIEANDTANALEAAGDAYRLGSKVYGRKSLNAAKLSINYAGLLNDTGDFKQARKVLKGKQKIMAAEYGETGVEMIPILVELGQAEFDLAKPTKGLQYFEQAAAVVARQDNEMYRGTKNFDFARLLLKRDARDHARPYIEAAYEIFARNLQPVDIRLGITSYQMSLWSLAEGRFEDAARQLAVSLKAFSAGDEVMGNPERGVRALLVRALEASNQGELATEHCLALGSDQEWTTPATPLYEPRLIPPPELKNSGIEGQVVLEFTVDEKGMVKDPKIATSTAIEYNQAALDMVKAFRYAPRFADGSAVATSGVQFSIDFAAPAPEPKAKRRFSMPPPRGMAGGGGMQMPTMDDMGGEGGGGKGK